MVNPYVDEIERIRYQNNKLWMNLLRLALEHAPIEAKKILKEINKNDKRISVVMEAIDALGN